MIDMALRCRGYDVSRQVGSLTQVTVQFILSISPNDCEAQAEALKKIELFLSGKVDLVRASDKPRCFYCGSLNDADKNQCSQCGAAL